MQPRLDASMLGLQPDIYQAMAAAALQETRSLDPPKVANPSFLPFQPNISSGSASLVQSQMLQEPQSQQTYIQSFPDNQVIAQAQILQQQLQRRLSNGDQQQQQQLQQQVQQSQQLHSQFPPQQLSKTISNLSQMDSSSQSQFSPLQALASSCQQQTFSDINHLTASNNSPMQSLLNSFSRDGASQLLNLHGVNSMVSPSPSSKRVALDSQISSRAAQSAVTQTDNMATPNSKISDLSPFLNHVTGREFSQFQSMADSHSSALFGLNTESPIMLQNGMPHLLNGGSSDNESLSMPFATSTYTSANGTDFPLNSDMTTSSCVDESGFLQSSENVDQANPSTRTFVKVRIVLPQIVYFLKKIIYLILVTISVRFTNQGPLGDHLISPNLAATMSCVVNLRVCLALKAY